MQAIDQAYAGHENKQNFPLVLVSSGSEIHSLFLIKTLCGAR